MRLGRLHSEESWPWCEMQRGRIGLANDVAHHLGETFPASDGTDGLNNTKSHQIDAHHRSVEYAPCRPFPRNLHTCIEGVQTAASQPTPLQPGGALRRAKPNRCALPVTGPRKHESCIVRRKRAQCARCTSPTAQEQTFDVSRSVQMDRLAFPLARSGREPPPGGLSVPSVELS